VTEHVPQTVHREVVGEQKSEARAWFYLLDNFPARTPRLCQHGLALPTRLKSSSQLGLSFLFHIHKITMDD
jgi:hypothetical protein